MENSSKGITRGTNNKKGHKCFKKNWNNTAFVYKLIIYRLQCIDYLATVKVTRAEQCTALRDINIENNGVMGMF